MLVLSMEWRMPSVNYPDSLQAHDLCHKFCFPRTSEIMNTRRWFPSTITLLLSTLSATTTGLILTVSTTSIASKLPFFISKITDQQLEKAGYCNITEVLLEQD